MHGPAVLAQSRSNLFDGGCTWGKRARGKIMSNNRHSNGIFPITVDVVVAAVACSLPRTGPSQLELLRQTVCPPGAPPLFTVHVHFSIVHVHYQQQHPCAR